MSAVEREMRIEIARMFDWMLKISWGLLSLITVLVLTKSFSKPRMNPALAAKSRSVSKTISGMRLR